LNRIVPTDSLGVMSSLIIGAFLIHFPAELAANVSLKAALEPIVQSNDGIFYQCNDGIC
jgi:hypothetical protein